MKILFSILVVFFCFFSCKIQPTEAINTYSTSPEIGRLTIDLPRYSTLSKPEIILVSTDLPLNFIPKQNSENTTIILEAPELDILPKQDSLVKDIYPGIIELPNLPTEIVTANNTPSLIQTINSAAFSWEIGIKITQILDVRTFEEFKSGHIYDAINMDVNSSSFVYQIQSLDKTSPVAVYSRSGIRSLKVAKILEENGFSVIYNLEGGLAQWTKNRGEIIK